MVQTSEKNAAIKTQIEFYMSDQNLARDKFFREQIMTDKEGWILISHFLNCNKIKSMKITQEEIAECVGDSTKVELSKDKLSVRRKDNEKLPEFVEKKRDEKAGDKKAAQVEKITEDVFDQDGKVILTEKDFDNP